MKADVLGVRISPPVLEFKDTHKHVLQRLSLSVKNVSPTGKAIKIYPPQTRYFQLKTTNEEKYIAAGLEMVAVIEYLSSKSSEYTDHITVVVDKQPIEVTIHATPSQPDLVLDGPITFGCIVANSHIFSQNLTLQNLGSEEGSYQIIYNGDKPITFVPSNGDIAAKSSKVIKVEFVSRILGVFDEIANISLQGQLDTALHVTGSVVNGYLQLLNIDDEKPLDCVAFGPTYYGTDRIHAAILYNNGPESVSFVVVLDEQATGQEVGEAGNSDKRIGRPNDLTSLVFAIPNQGQLIAYEKMVIFFQFSPRWCQPTLAFKTLEKFPPQQDFSLFMNLKVVGASYGFQKLPDPANTDTANMNLEICLTGCAVPVLLTFPKSLFDFGECSQGGRVERLAEITNGCEELPLIFRFRRVAHFSVRPTHGRVMPGRTTELVLTFNPKQAGNFKVDQYVDIMGLVSDPDNPFCIKEEIIYSVPITVTASASQSTRIKNPVFNLGITPQVTNEVGMYVATDPKTFARQAFPPQQALLRSMATSLHGRPDGRPDGQPDTMVALPNDRAASVRPTDPRYKTPFTKETRHTYVDPDFAYTPVEMQKIKKHRQRYINYLERRRQNRRNRQWTEEYYSTNNAKDITIKPGIGLKPRKLKIQEMAEDTKLTTSLPRSAFRLLNTTALARAELLSSSQVMDGLNAEPATRREQQDCERDLNPQELHQIIIGPPTVDFGNICLKSVSEKKLHIINNLDYYIHVVLQVDCRELRQSSPLSQVVPPCSKTYLPLIFESSFKGNFQSSLKYTVNKHYKSYITVFANVIPVALEMSTDNLKLEEHAGLPAVSGLRGVVTLYNRLNHRAEFTWAPIIGPKGTAFSIRPAAGVVAPYSELDCEVVFHPSFLAPEEGYFNLQVVGGEQHRFSTIATLGIPNVSFIDRRLSFGQVPLNLTTTRVATLTNSSMHHAYFQVTDVSPIEGLTVSPVFGVVPVGGTAELRLELKPSVVAKFDTRIVVAVRGGRSQELRIGGNIEMPTVRIDVVQFVIGGVACGTSRRMPFSVYNCDNTKVEVVFDLRKFPDFQIKFIEYDLAEVLTDTPQHVHSILVFAEMTVECELVFSPTEVASYDFHLPLAVNGTSAVEMPPLSDSEPRRSIAPTRRLFTSRDPRADLRSDSRVDIPQKRVLATALPEPLQLSAESMEFELTPRERQLALDTGTQHVKNLVLVNSSQVSVSWLVDLSQDGPALGPALGPTLGDVFRFIHPSGAPFSSVESGRGVGGPLAAGETVILGVVFCPEHPGYYKVSLPIVLNNNFDEPYRTLTLTGYLRSPTLTFQPSAVVFSPVPLLTSVSVEFEIRATSYRENCRLELVTPTILLDDGTLSSPLSAEFLQLNDVVVPVVDEDGVERPAILRVKVTFYSAKPISFSEPIIITDEFGNSFSINMTATADNCLLTCYPFLARNTTEHHIVVEQNGKAEGHVQSCTIGRSLRGRCTVSRESSAVGEAVMVSVESVHDNSSRPSTMATTSVFEMSNSSYGKSSSSEEESTPISDASPVSALQPADETAGGSSFTVDTSLQAQLRGCMEECTLGPTILIDDATDEGIFYTEVLVAVQRWFSSQGWPTGPHPVIIPDTLRSGISRKPRDAIVRNSKGRLTDSSNNVKKDFATVYDMVAHLTGRPIPGIPINNPLPIDNDELVKQIYWQHCTLLTFLRTQGALLASVRPEYLMESGDYFHWRKMKRELDGRKVKNGRQMAPPPPPPDGDNEARLFEMISRRAWTDVLLQLLKVVVLGRLTPRQMKTQPSPYSPTTLANVDPNPLCSNIYSVGERLILLWLNHNYEQQRKTVWKDCSNGGQPPSRWVVNFDFDLLDGLVIAAAMAAYCPFLIQTHLQNMYTQPNTAEQCLHNALKVVNAMRYIHITYDIQAIDITDPNPISLLLLCVHLYGSLPAYLPISTIQFSGGLHATVTRQVRVTNPSGRLMGYHSLLVGHDSRDFRLPRGDSLQVSRKSRVTVPVEFTSRFLRPAEALLLLVGRRHGAIAATTMVFQLRTHINNITKKVVIHCESASYELSTVVVEVRNPFSEGGEFRIVVAESADSGMSSLLQPVPSERTKKSKLKLVPSRTNHGQERKTDTLVTPSTQLLDSMRPPVASPLDGRGLNVFSCRRDSVYLRPEGVATVFVDYLPFGTGTHHCTLLFINETIGEFVYSMEGTATVPLIQSVPFRRLANNSVRVHTADTADGDTAHSEDSIVYWQCKPNVEVQEILHVPVINEARDRALVLAATQRMTEEELERRRKCGMMMNDSLVRSAMRTLGLMDDVLLDKGKTFTVSIDSGLFSAPSTIYIPNPHHALHTGQLKDADQSLDDSTVELPLTFECSQPGQYPCNVTLTADDDIRIYSVHCGVLPTGTQAEMEFTTPLHQTLLQEVPIVNNTSREWPIEAMVEGVGFSGPLTLMAKPYETTKYPLSFTPHLEGVTKGKLMLHNLLDGVQNVYTLLGKGDCPLPQETIYINCSVKQSCSKIVNVPNYLRRKIKFDVVSSIDFISGLKNVTILGGQTLAYEVNVLPLKRGRLKGVLSFVVSNVHLQRVVDSDGDEMPDDGEQDPVSGYRVWFALDINVLPAAPEQELELACACQQKAVVDVSIANPTDDVMTVEAEVLGEALSGPSSLTIPARGAAIYELTFTPAFIGNSSGSLVLYNPLVGEFWYALWLLAERPSAVCLPRMTCEVGELVQTNINLNNPTDETLRLVPTLSNTNNFVLDRDDERPLVLRPRCSLSVPVTFRPSAVGPADHTGTITFLCEQLGEWVYELSGAGLLPRVQPPLCVTAHANSSNTFIIAFYNPLDDAVLVRVRLLHGPVAGATRQGAPLGGVGEPTHVNGLSPVPAAESFCLLLKEKDNVRLGPKSTLDIPISFAPGEMRMFEASCHVCISKEDGTAWRYEQPVIEDRLRDETTLTQIEWLYPLHGYPEVLPDKTCAPILLECRSRERLEETLEVVLKGMRPSFYTLGGGRTSSREGVRSSSSEGYKFEVLYGEDSEAEEDLSCAVAVTLLDQTVTPDRSVHLTFGLVYAPYLAMSHAVEFVVRSAAGGVWRFPLHFAASQPKPDDTVTIEATGLGKVSSVGFRLTSQTRYPMPYKAYFMAGSDSEFTVSPATGELLPVDTAGSLICISFTPLKYGKVHQGRLVIQCSDMQWTYQIIGTPPGYLPPMGCSGQPIAGPHPDLRRRKEKRNFVRDNLLLMSTAVSSPMKGESLLLSKQSESLAITGL